MAAEINGVPSLKYSDARSVKLTHAKRRQFWRGSRVSACHAHQRISCSIYYTKIYLSMLNFTKPIHKTIRIYSCKIIKCNIHYFNYNIHYFTLLHILTRPTVLLLLGRKYGYFGIANIIWKRTTIQPRFES